MWKLLPSRLTSAGNTLLIVDFDEKSVCLESFEDPEVILSGCLKIQALRSCDVESVFEEIRPILENVDGLDELTQDQIFVIEKAATEYWC